MATRENRGVRLVALGGLGLGLTGCPELNPDFMGPAGTSTGATQSSSGAVTTPGSADETSSSAGTTGDTTSGPGTTLSETGTTSVTGSGSSTTGGPLAHEYVATIAVCTDPEMLDPALCEQEAGANHMRVDTGFSLLDDEPTTVWLRFDLDDAFMVTDSTTVTLRLVVGSTPDGDSRSTGELWEVEPFDLADLSSTQPGRVGDRLGDDLGTANTGETIQWPLPTALVTPGGSVYLAVTPVSDDGVDYWNADGDEPPVLTIEP